MFSHIKEIEVNIGRNFYFITGEILRVVEIKILNTLDTSTTD